MNETDNAAHSPVSVPSNAPKVSYSRSRRILVIDDEQIVCQLVQGFLSTDGWEVETTQSLEQAWDFIEHRRYPVVLCDVHLPGSSADFLQQYKLRFPHSQIIMFTGDPTVNSVREALQFGAYDYVPKPCRRDELIRIVQRAFDKYLLLCEQERLQTENESYRRQLEELVEKRTEQLRESELRYRALFNRAVDAIFLVDIPSGMICDLNMAAAHMVGNRGTDLINRPIRDLVGDQLAAVIEEAQEPGHREWRFEHIVFSLNGSSNRVAQVAIGKVEFNGQTCLQVVARDITAHVQLTERSELIERELQNEQRLAAIGLLASGIAHNINSPLMGIYGAAQLIKMKYPDITDIDGVITQVERINGIVRNLMWKSRQEQETQKQEINLNQLLQEELKFLEADLEFKHNVRKHYSFADDIPAIWGRYSDFSQSIMNVVRNALDSMHACEAKEIAVSTKTDGDAIHITVKDSGCGIAAEDHDKIFLPFYTTKPVVGNGKGHEPTGTGLGLSTVQKLLAPYGAYYDIHSEINRGTSFTICLPLNANIAGLGEQYIEKGTCE